MGCRDQGNGDAQTGIGDPDPELVEENLSHPAVRGRQVVREMPATVVGSAKRSSMMPSMSFSRKLISHEHPGHDRS